MKIQTFSIVAGTEACNASCQFCVSKMTLPMGVPEKRPDPVDWRNFEKACLLAKESGTTTVMITGKGEPTLFPEQITEYLDHLKEFRFPLIELQTNGIPIARNKARYDPHLGDWYERGLNTIAVSIVHYEPEMNRHVYLPLSREYINLPGLIDRLHEKRYTVRLGCIMADGFIDDAYDLHELIGYARKHHVEQLTVRPVNKPEESKDSETERWVLEHYLKNAQLNDIQYYLSRAGTQIMKLVHGATVYDVKGQNVCLTHSLTIDPNSEDIRQLIFYPDGSLGHDWQYEGAIILGGGNSYA